MACCLLATLFVGGIWTRSPQEFEDGLRPRSTAAALLGARWKLWIVLLAALELVVAFLLARLVLTAATGDAAHHLQHGGDQGSVPMAALISLGVCVVALALCATACTASWGRARMVVGLAGMLVAIVAAAWPATWDLHVSWMAQFMLVAVAGPATIGRWLAQTAVGEGLSESARRIALPLLGTVIAGVMLGAHFAPVHTSLMADAVARVSVIVGVAVTSTAFWDLFWDNRSVSVTGARIGGILALGIPSGLLGLTLLVAPGPLWPTMIDASHTVSPILEQRLAGMVMMAVDLIFLLPALSFAVGSIPLVRRRASVAGAIQ